MAPYPEPGYGLGFLRWESGFGLGVAPRTRLQQQLESGRDAFAHLLRAWHKRNGWPHTMVPRLGQHMQLGRVHPSQISMLKHSKLVKPGPEVFLTIGRVNRWLWPWSPSRSLRDLPLAGCPEGELLERNPPVALLDESGQPLGPGQFLEIFTGLTTPPPSFDLRIGEQEATALCGALSDWLTGCQPWRQCKAQVLAAYPVERSQRRQQFEAVLSGQKDYTATELEAELDDLHRTACAMAEGAAPWAKTPGTIDQFLSQLRQQSCGPDADGEGISSRC